MSYIKGESREQKLLFPDVIDDYVTEDNPVRFIDGFVDELDLEELGFQKSQLAPTGRPPYHLRDLLTLNIYGYSNRVRSSSLGSILAPVTPRPWPRGRRPLYIVRKGCWRRRLI